MILVECPRTPTMTMQWLTRTRERKPSSRNQATVSPVGIVGCASFRESTVSGFKCVRLLLILILTCVITVINSLMPSLLGYHSPLDFPPSALELGHE